MVLSILIGALRRASLLCVPAAVLLAAPTPSTAQSFFETLFGGGKKPVAQNFSAPPQRLAPIGHAGANAGGNAGHVGGYAGAQISPASVSTSRSNAVNPNRSNRDDDDNEGAKGGHRTVCVRLCDGYYWPVSHAVKRSQFRKDSRTCEASCNGDAKLFHLPSNGDINDAVDQSGKPYGRLPAAFLYRKKLVAGCACRPEAWSDVELSRHQVYALNDAQEKARKAAEDAAEDARVAAAEAAKAEAAQRLAEAKLPGKKSKLGTGAVAEVGPAPLKAPAMATAATSEDAVVGSASVASATVLSTSVAPPDSDPALADAAAALAVSRKSRNRQNRDVAGQIDVRTANSAVVGGGRSQSQNSRSQAGRQQNLRPQPKYASASPLSSPGFSGPNFGKKHTWPGD
jgi:Protein of unknown function (DUF2865)